MKMWEQVLRKTYQDKSWRTIRGLGSHSEKKIDQKYRKNRFSQSQKYKRKPEFFVNKLFCHST